MNDPQYFPLPDDFDEEAFNNDSDFTIAAWVDLANPPPWLYIVLPEEP